MPSCSLAKFNLAEDWGNTILLSPINLHATVCTPRSRPAVSVALTHILHIQEGLNPNHLKKAKLMFFYTRYPSSNVLKTYFPDVKVSHRSQTVLHLNIYLVIINNNNVLGLEKTIGKKCTKKTPAWCLSLRGPTCWRAAGTESAVCRRRETKKPRVQANKGTKLLVCPGGRGW